MSTKPALWQYGRKLRRWLRTDEAYALLDAAASDGNATWVAGGCKLLADALLAVLPGSHLAAIYSTDNRHIQHYVVELDGWYFDGDGASSRRVLMHRWRYIEYLPVSIRLTFDVQSLTASDDIPSSAAVSGELAAAILARIGAPD